MKITIGRKPKKLIMLFYLIQGLVMGLFSLGIANLVIKNNNFGKVLYYILFAFFLVLILEVHYLSSIKYWEINQDHIHFIMPNFRLSLLKEILRAFKSRTLKPTLSLSINEIAAISIDVRFYIYIGYQLKEPHTHLIFYLNDGSTLSMFAGDGHYQNEMIQAILYLQAQGVQFIDPYHLLDDPTHLFEKVSQFQC